METKPDLLNDVELRSDSVQAILTRPPHWMVRWGNTLLFIVILMVLVLSYFIKYPEYISAPILITSQNPPEKISARKDSRIEEVLVKDQQSVKKGQILMILQSAANYRDVLKLKRLVDSLPVASLSSFPLAKASALKLGELQGDFDFFAEALRDQQQVMGLKTYAPESAAINREIAENTAQLTALLQQLAAEKAQLRLSRKNYSTSQLLFSQDAVSKTALENAKIKFLQAQQNVKTTSLLIAQLRRNIINLNVLKDRVEIDKQENLPDYETKRLQLFDQMRKSLHEWEQNFLLVSSTNGIVSFPQFYGKNQFVKAGDVLMSVLPNDRSVLVGSMQVPSLNSGKIVPGQKVLIKLDNYPYHDYGMLQGKVVSVSLTPDEKGRYYVHVELPDGLKTTYHKNLTFDRELKGEAKIVTKNLRLIERFFNKTQELLVHKD